MECDRFSGICLAENVSITTHLVLSGSVCSGIDEEIEASPNNHRADEGHGLHGTWYFSVDSASQMGVMGSVLEIETKA